MKMPILYLCATALAGLLAAGAAAQPVGKTLVAQASAPAPQPGASAPREPRPDHQPDARKSPQPEKKGRPAHAGCAALGIQPAPGRCRRRYARSQGHARQQHRVDRPWWHARLRGLFGLGWNRGSALAFRPRVRPNPAPRGFRYYSVSRKKESAADIPTQSCPGSRSHPPTMTEDPPPSRAPLIRRRPMPPPGIAAAKAARLHAASLCAIAATPRLGCRAPPLAVRLARARPQRFAPAHHAFLLCLRGAPARPLMFSVET
jgi:hypothetical protein